MTQLNNKEPRILTFDIESSLQKAYIWQPGWKLNVSYTSVIEEQFMLGFSYKWLDEQEVYGESLHKESVKSFLSHNDRSLVLKLKKLLDEADVVVTYNGNRFDIPLFNGLCLKYGITPPSPYKSVDLFQTVRSKFKLNSKKLDYINKLLGYEGKDEMCYQDWIDCDKNIVSAYEKMETYCNRDVIALEEAYKRILPWIRNHPNMSVLTGDTCCTKCTSTNLRKGGWTIRYANGKQYRRVICQDCGNHCVDKNESKGGRDDKALISG